MSQRRKILYKKYLEEHGKLGESGQQDSDSVSIRNEEENASNMRLILNEAVQALKSVLFIAICITILFLACIGAVVMVKEPLRKDVLDIVLPVFFR